MSNAHLGISRPANRATPEQLLRATCASILLTLAPGIVTSQTSSCPGIHVTILDIRNSTGTVDCALYDGPKGFPADLLRSATRSIPMKVPGTVARCDFEGIPSGAYALVVAQDENMNGKLDTRWPGIPTESHGFSNDAKASFGPLRFAAASCIYDAQSLDLTIRLRGSISRVHSSERVFGSFALPETQSLARVLGGRQLITVADI
jgi:uncharacterized protein (DUF2141 family)